MDDPQPKRWWLIITAAILALLTLYYYTGSWIVVAVFLAVFAVFVIRHTRQTNAPRSHACLRCGAPLNPNARSCNACGSASWTIRN